MQVRATQAEMCRTIQSSRSRSTLWASAPLSIFVAHSSLKRRSRSVSTPIESTADSVLMEAIAGGDDAALAMIYDRYSAILYGMLIRILRDKHAAEEVLQDLFLQIWRKPHQFDPRRGCFRAWLLVIGRNRAISRLRTEPNRESLEERSDDYADAFVSLQNLEDEISSLEIANRLRAALLNLPPEQRRALELAYFDGLSQSEIAAKTESPVGTVKSRIRLGIAVIEADSGGRQWPQSSAVMFSTSLFRIGPREHVDSCARSVSAHGPTHNSLQHRRH